MRAKPESEWTADNVTARDLVQDSAIVVTFRCEGCRCARRFNLWKIGDRLADTAIRSLRFRCHRCGVYPQVLTVQRVCPTGGRHSPVFSIDLKPRAWDLGHEEAQRQALARAGLGTKPDDRR